MSKNIFTSLEQQLDLSNIKLIGTGMFTSVYKVRQVIKDGSRVQVVRVVKDISNYQSIKREKMLLTYFNRDLKFIHFNGTRKVGYYHLQFFDFVGKRNLKQYIKQKGTLSAMQAKDLLEDMVAVLEKVHGADLIHGNIKPTNIVVGKNSCYLVGCAESIPSLNSFETEMLGGDKKYCPPERLNGVLGEAGDIYLLGCTLYYALAGKHIFRLDKVDDIGRQLWAQVHHSVRKMNKLPIFWRYLIFWMTQKNPKKRPSLVELRTWLKDITVPDWVRKISVRAEKSYPDSPLKCLADEHYLYPIFKKALGCEISGDLETAFNLYENCAFRGYSRAENNIGLMYEYGNPVKQSYPMAANMYQHAFEKGNPFAAYNLARLSDGGLGVPENLEEAYRFYKFAALRGHLKAQNELALMYLNGRGVTKNVDQAQFWLEMAANYGNELAKRNIQLLPQLA